MGLGIMGTMEMARNAMRTARTGAEVSGNNLANASNPTYARQRIKIAHYHYSHRKRSTRIRCRSSTLGASTRQGFRSSLISESVTQYFRSKQLYLRRAKPDWADSR